LHSASRPERRGRAFTLIELLVVIAVIALLVAILVPSLQRARSLAVRAVCASNQRNLVSGLFTYASDYGEAIPPAGVCDLPTYIYWVGTSYGGEPHTADLRAFGTGKYAPDHAWMCPGFQRSSWFATGSNRPYWFAWYDDPSEWANAVAGRRNWLGYNYLHSSHIIWEQRYGIYQGVQALRIGKTYPCGHDPNFRFESSIILTSCLNYNGDQITPYWLPMEAVLDYPWVAYAHDNGRPEGSNYMLGDGSVHWVGLEGVGYKYNGWALVDWAMLK